MTVPDHEPEASLNVDLFHFCFLWEHRIKQKLLNSPRVEDIWGLFPNGAFFSFSKLYQPECLIAPDKLFKWSCTHRPQLCFSTLVFFSFQVICVFVCVCFCTSVSVYVTVSVYVYVCDCPCDQTQRIRKLCDIGGCVTHTCLCWPFSSRPWISW